MRNSRKSPCARLRGAPVGLLQTHAAPHPIAAEIARSARLCRFIAIKAERSAAARGTNTGPRLAEM